MARWASRPARRNCAASSARTSKKQMQAFKAGSRHNDISEQMRSVARPLTSDEIAKLAAYYSSFAK